MKKKRKKYRLGSNRNGVNNNYIQNPKDALIENDIDMVGADYAADSNKYLAATQALGGFLMNKGLQQFMLGGNVGQVPVEVEGKESAETPDGQTMKFNGPSHSQGGIDISLPSGTKIYSDKIKVGKDSMSKRKLKRKRKELTLTDLYENDKSNPLFKNGLARTQETNDLQDKDDLHIQELVKEAKGGGERGKYPDGSDGIVAPLNKIQPYMMQLEDPFDIDKTVMDLTKNHGGLPIVPRQGMDFSGLQGVLGNTTGGDILGLGSALYSAFTGRSNTQKNRAGDTPNVNSYLDYGQDSLDTIEKTKGYLKGEKSSAKQNLELARRAATIRGRNGARGIGTMRAMDIANSKSMDLSENNINSQFAQQMMSLLGQEASLQSNIDSVVMGGEERKDTADRMDRDNYYSQLGEDNQSIGTGLQSIAKMMNKNSDNKANMDMIEMIKKSGMSQADISQLFMMFQQMQNSTGQTTKAK